MKLISLNIEGDKHYDKIFPFIKKEQPDMVCFQEVFEEDVPLLEETLEMKGYFQPGVTIHIENPHLPARGVLGVAQFTSLPVSTQKTEYYVGTAERLPFFFENQNPNAMNRMLVVQTIQSEEGSFTIGTTHFTWSMEGAYTDEQRRDFDALRNILVTFDELILCGDFNSPRNGEPENVYNSLVKMYQDAIPPHYQTSIDSTLHKSGKQIMLMVDGLFLSQQYQASQVRLVDRVSDHMAIVAEIFPLKH